MMIGPQTTAALRRFGALCFVALLSVSGVVAGAEDGADQKLGPSARPDHYTYDIVSVDRAQRNLADADGDLERVRGRIEKVAIDRLAHVDRTAGLRETEKATVREVEGARGDLRHLAVGAFITGGAELQTSALMESLDANDLTWRNYLVVEQTIARARAAAHMDEVRRSTSRALFELGVGADSIAALEEQLEDDRVDLLEQVAVAEVELVIAQAWDRAERAMVAGPYGIAPESAWENLKACESMSDYRAVSPTGVYRGAYQFDLETWRSVGGVGDPINAVPEEQDARARTLYAERGRGPWPECGPASLP